MNSLGGAMKEKMKNRRFRETEEAIFDAFIKLSPNISIDEIVKMAGISRATFYRHHCSMDAIIIDYRQFVLENYDNRLVSVLKSEEIGGRELVYRIVYYIFSNRKTIKQIALFDKGLFFYELIKLTQIRMLEQIEMEGSIYIYNICVGEMVAILMDWYENDFSENRLPKVYEDIVYLSETINERLSLLNN